MIDRAQPDFRALMLKTGFDVLKNPDLHFVDRRGVVAESGAPRFPSRGTPDCTFIGHTTLGGYCEVKTARGPHRERYDFNQFDEAKRQWIDARPHALSSYWVYIGFGKRVKDDKYPKAAIMIPLADLFALEVLSPRKSLSYLEATQSPWALVWEPGKGFAFPQNHPFRTIYGV